MTKLEAANVVREQGPRVKEQYGWDYYAGWKAGLLRGATADESKTED